MEGNSAKGTQFKLNIFMSMIGGYHLSGLEWEAVVSTYVLGGIAQRFQKSDAHKVDEDNYTIIVDTTVGGAGAYWLTLSVDIPDSTAKGGKRKEKVSVFTGVVIDDVI